MEWDIRTKEKFETIISKMPLFHRGIANCAVSKKAEEIAGLKPVPLVEEEEVIKAFFSEVPTPFYSMMIRLLEQCEFDYKKYGFPKNEENCGNRCGCNR
ncbi:MAG: hypothetical protein ABH836_06485 [Candidatus Omnitrophota bacterium]